MPTVSPSTGPSPAAALPPAIARPSLEPQREKKPSPNRELCLLESHDSLGLKEAPPAIPTPQGPRRSLRLTGVGVAFAFDEPVYSADVSDALHSVSVDHQALSATFLADIGPDTHLAPAAIHLADLLLDDEAVPHAFNAQETNKDPYTLTVDEAIASPERDLWIAATDKKQ